MELLASCDCLSDWLTDWGCEKAQPGRQCSVIRLSPVEQTPPPPCQSLQSLLSPHPDSFIPSSSGRILQSHYQLILDILRRKIWCHLTFRTLSFSPSPRPTPPPALPLDCTLYRIQGGADIIFILTFRSHQFSQANYMRPLLKLRDWEIINTIIL